ncbi:hypothetical protein CW304_32920 [Bacillus sp. UFRGS-B20]|nr:hypothetical protein CW304_32920 [Bacillus sp. UFRGS-B20]
MGTMHSKSSPIAAAYQLSDFVSAVRSLQYRVMGCNRSWKKKKSQQRLDAFFHFLRLRFSAVGPLAAMF